MKLTILGNNGPFPSAGEPAPDILSLKGYKDIN